MYGVYYRPIVLVAMLGLMGFLIYGLKNPNPELKYTVMSASLLIIIVALDVLSFIIFEYSSIFAVAAFGMVFFVGMQTVLISNRYLHSLQQAATLGKEMKVMNANLEIIVEERTAELAEKNQQLEQIARTDPLTGLANRRELEKWMNIEISRSLREVTPLTCLYLDVDLFKKVNDQYGHDIGDQVLQKVSAVLLDAVRTGDVVARYGGEEFVVILPGITGLIAIETAERLRCAVANTNIELKGQEPLGISVSVGLASFIPKANSIGDSSEIADELLISADRALMIAKEQGRNRVVVAD